MRFKALWVAGIFFASTSIALAANIPAGWIGSKAEKIVIRDATVRLPAQERKAFETELRDDGRPATGCSRRPQHVQHGEYEQPGGKDPQPPLPVLDRAEAAFSRGSQSMRPRAPGPGPRSADNRFKPLSLRGDLRGARDPVGGGHLGRRPDHRRSSRASRACVGPFERELDVRVTGQSTIAARQVE